MLSNLFIFIFVLVLCSFANSHLHSYLGYTVCVPFTCILLFGVCCCAVKPEFPHCWINKVSSKVLFLFLFLNDYFCSAFIVVEHLAVSII